MSKFGGVDYILNVQDFGTSAKDKNIITESALRYAAYKHIPLQRRFTTRKRESDQRSKFDIRPFSHKNEFNFVSENSLTPVTERDKLFIFAHADDSEVGFAEAKHLAGMLVAFGLRKVGLITFKACEVGSGTFLENFVAALERRAVIIGWAKGYKGEARTVTRRQGGVVIKVFEKILDENEDVLTGDDRLKIVRGTTGLFSQDFGRYTVA